MKSITIHTDGACQGNPGPGGWAAILTYGSKCREISGGEPVTTNNRMELTAAIEALRMLKEACVVELHTDSVYLKSGITKWIHGWKKGGWRTASRQPVKNADLWRALDELCVGHRVTWHWVKGHAGHAENERCDGLAVAAIVEIRKRYTAAELKARLAEWLAREQTAGPDLLAGL